MNEWIDFSVYAAFLVVFWFIFPARNSQWETLMLADRNPAWLAAHPEVNRKLAASRWHSLGGYILGTLSLAILLAAQLEFWPRSAGLSSDNAAKWNQLWDITTRALGLGMTVLIILGFLKGIDLNSSLRQAPMSATPRQPGSSTTSC